MTELQFKHESVGFLEDGRVQVKITCENEWLDKPISVITNNDQIGITPFDKGHIARLKAYDEQDELIVIYGYFAEKYLRDRDENVYIDGICDSLISGATEDLFGGYDGYITKVEDIKPIIPTFEPLRELNLEDIKNLLKDPEHILVVDAMSCEDYIYTSGQRMNKMVEQIHIDNGTSEQLQELVEANVIFYGGLVNNELTDKLAVPQFYDLWYEDIYGPQPDEGYQKAKFMGLETNTKD
jgi:hypothetical protein